MSCGKCRPFCLGFNVLSTPRRWGEVGVGQGAQYINPWSWHCDHQEQWHGRSCARLRAENDTGKMWLVPSSDCGDDNKHQDLRTLVYNLWAIFFNFNYHHVYDAFVKRQWHFSVFKQSLNTMELLQAGSVATLVFDLSFGCL